MYSSRSEEFDAFFGSGDMALPFQLAMDGKLGSSSMRSVCWKIFLGLLSANNDFENWQRQASSWREQYETLRKRHEINPYDMEEDDPLVHNPLSQSENSAWNLYFQKEEAQKEIMQDVNRLHPGMDFFENSVNQRMQLDILFTWTREHPDVGYRQGMHELLSVFFLAIMRDRDDSSPESHSNSIFRCICDPRYVEHDSFALFNALMTTMMAFFDNRPRESSMHRSISSSSSSDEFLSVERSVTSKRLTGRDLTKLGAVSLGSAAGLNDEPRNETAIVSIGRLIQHELLKDRDSRLYGHLKSHGVEPQLYTLRWVRLLFAREFHLEDTMLLWDAIFADSQDLTLVPHICIAMLLYIRVSLLQSDSEGCLRRLLKYPPMEDAHQLIRKALESRKNKKGLLEDTIVPDPPIVPKVEPTHSSAPSKPRALKQHSSPTHLDTSSFSHPASAPFSSEIRPPARVDPSILQGTDIVSSGPNRDGKLKEAARTSLHRVEPQSSSSQVRQSDREELMTVRNELNLVLSLQRRMGTKLDEIIRHIQEEITKPAENRNDDELFLALAGLKQVRDVLVFRIGDDAFESAQQEPMNGNGVILQPIPENDIEQLHMGHAHVNPTEIVGNPQSFSMVSPVGIGHVASISVVAETTTTGFTSDPLSGSRISEETSLSPL